MFKSSDRSKLLNYLSKKTPEVKVVPPTTTITTSNHANQKPSHKAKTSVHRQQVSTSSATAASFTVTTFAGKSDDSRKSKKKGKKQIVPTDSGDQIVADEMPKPTVKVPSKKGKKNKNKKNDADQKSQDDKIVVHTIESSKVINSKNNKSNNANANRKRTREQALMQDVKNMIADFHDNGIGEDEGFDEDQEEEEDDVVKLAPHKKPKNEQKSIDVPEEVSRRSSELGAKARQTLAASMFRSLNEYLYTNDSSATRKEFTVNKFKMYHEAYEKLMTVWPLKPIDYLIDVLQKRIKPTNMEQMVIADVGCGSRPRIAEAFPSATVHSYDLHQNDPTDARIISADMSRLPLDSEQCDFVVYSLSLMPTNLKDVIREANRILKLGGYMLVVEVSSRFADYKCSSGRQLAEEKHVGHRFALDLKSYGFQLTAHEELKPNGFFVYLCFKKSANVETLAPKSKLPPITLKPCLYKAR